MNNSEALGVSIFKTRIGEGGNINRRIYNLIMGLCLIWGFIFNFFVCAIFGDTILNFVTNGIANYFIFIIAYFALAIGGIIVCMKAQNLPLVF